MATLYKRVGGRRKIGILVRNFYLSLQLDPVLSPVFSAHVQDWPKHYETLTDFWTVQTGGPATYTGRLIQTHVRLELGPEHYERWLAQWRRSCTLHFEPPEAQEMVALAEGLARRMPRAEPAASRPLDRAQGVSGNAPDLAQSSERNGEAGNPASL